MVLNASKRKNTDRLQEMSESGNGNEYVPD